MNEIICPHCNKAFKVDESGYADILKQVRDSEFDKQLHDRLELAEKDKLSAIELAQSKVASQKDIEISNLKAKLDAGETNQKLAVSQALNVVEKERDNLLNELKKVKLDMENATKLAQMNLLRQIQDVSAQKDAQIQKLQSMIDNSETTKQLAITQAVSVVEKERDHLKNQITQVELQNQVTQKSLEDKYITQIKDRDDAIERLKDMKAKLSTKMVGETLEIHCETEFNRIRPTAFPRAYFEKDNDARTGSKGDYIFKDLDENGTEIVSIMFEMKNENDSTATKKKMKIFLKNLIKIEMKKGVNMLY